MLLGLAIFHEVSTIEKGSKRYLFFLLISNDLVTNEDYLRIVKKRSKKQNRYRIIYAQSF